MKDVNRQSNIEELIQLVSFNIGNEEFGVEILKVQEIIRSMQIVHVPNSPSFIDGVINLRGRVIPIVNLRVRLGINRIEHDKSTRIIVVEINNKTIGFVVDSVSEVLRISGSIMEAPPSIVSGINSEYITSIGKLDDRLLILLDLEKLFSLEESKMLESTTE
jgi:purine-binding chemotaxis protein CheW